MGIQGRGPQCCPPNYAGGSTGEWGTPTEVTLNVSGVITLTEPGWYTVNTYENAESDDLVKIEGLVNGDEIILKPANDARTVVVTHGAYIKLNGGANFTMNSIYDRIRLQCVGSDVCVECGGRSSGGS